MIKLIFVSYIILGILVNSAKSQLKTGFYSRTCPRAEVIVKSVVQTHFKSNPTLAPALLRLHFHDCFIKGCDASVLISGPSTERTAFPNVGLRGFEVIDNAKSQLESVCPGVVSCADILTLAARDAVALTGGPSWGVPLGRRDGRESSASDVPQNLASPFDSVAVQRQKFAAKGLNDLDLVTLVGAHTIGHTQCRFFQYRIYNFTTKGTFDPSINPSLVGQLQRSCPQNGDGLNKVPLDRDSSLKFDTTFFKNLKVGNAILESDQKLMDDGSTRAFVDKYARNGGDLRFKLDFLKAMVKMGNIEVKTGTNGEIRRICSKIN
ncbi:hypothetical protein RND81_07G108600 [Saponaria officinalis]|uniref:Peroxidase n=1 Tax=Saponaria officinalis TaxID=3572 RepID=A0AAW1JSY3_SAPOF